MSVTRKQMTDLLRLAGHSGLSRKSREELLALTDSYLNRYKYAPRYLRGLTPEEKRQRKWEIRWNILKERATGIPSYKPVATDRGRQTKVSQYTKTWYKHFPDAHSLRAKADVSGVPLDILHKVDEKGRAAWRGGQHRPGAGQAQWGIARVNSFLTCGKTFFTADHVLAEQALQRSPRARKHFRKMGCGEKGEK